MRGIVSNFDMRDCAGSDLSARQMDDLLFGACETHGFGGVCASVEEKYVGYGCGG